jgi:YfiH family protein
MTGKNWIEANWPAPVGVQAGTTLRHPGHSGKCYASLNLGAHVGDAPDAVADNRQRFRQLCALPSEPLWIHQVHGATIVVDPPADSYPEADAVVSRQAGSVCAVLTADCLPALFVSADGREVAAAHAGWRGLLQGVLEATVDAMTSPAGDVLAWLGPAISQPAFEVGGEVREQFVALDPTATRHFAANNEGRWQADLYGLARQQLARAGVVQVYGGSYCTCRDANSFFSFRRDGQCGRMASFVFRDTA